MDLDPERRILAAERVANGVVVTFGDNKSALYSASLLRGILLDAEELKDFEDDVVE